MKKYEKPEANMILVTDIVTVSSSVDDTPPGCQGAINTYTH